MKSTIRMAACLCLLLAAASAKAAEDSPAAKKELDPVLDRKLIESSRDYFTRNERVKICSEITSADRSTRRSPLVL